MHHYTPDSAWWNFAAVGNYAARFYAHAMHVDGPVRRLQAGLQADLQAAVADVEAKVVAVLAGKAGKTTALLTAHAKVGRPFGGSPYGGRTSESSPYGGRPY